MKSWKRLHARLHGHMVSLQVLGAMSSMKCQDKTQDPLLCNLPAGLSVAVVTFSPLLSSWFLLLPLSSSFLIPSSATEFFSCCCWPCTLATAELFSSEQSISERLAHVSLATTNYTTKYIFFGAVFPAKTIVPAC